MFLKWETIYSVNIQIIDEQHKKIFELINRVHGLTDKSINHTSAKEIVEQLKDYGSYHLDTEEELFKKYNYPEASPHIAQHDQYRKIILDLEEKIKKDSGEEAFEKLSSFLKDWWLNHIQNIDQKYSVFFNEQGLF